MPQQVDFIGARYGELRRSEKRVADYVLANAGEVIHFSVSQLAEETRVSDPTVIRFCQALGFRGFQDFKIHLAQTVIPSVRTIHESVTETEEAPELVRKVFDANVDAVARTSRTLDYEAVRKAIDALAAAGHIVFFGLGGSAVVAMDAYHKFFRIGIPCEWFNDGHMAIMSGAMLKSGDVFVAISHSGATHEVIDAVEAAGKSGATTIAIVSHEKSALSKAAQLTLRVGSSETGFRFEPMASRIAQLCVVDVLSVGVSLLRSEAVLANLAKSRKALAKQRY